LAFAVLTLKAFGIKDILKFPFMTPPARKGLILALEHLYSLNALDNKGELTQLGRDMSSFPLEPRFAKILLESKVIHSIMHCNYFYFN
jgi:HrpA-like RNA helicase